MKKTISISHQGEMTYKEILERTVNNLISLNKYITVNFSELDESQIAALKLVSENSEIIKEIIITLDKMQEARNENVTSQAASQ